MSAAMRRTLLARSTLALVVGGALLWAATAIWSTRMLGDPQIGDLAQRPADAVAMLALTVVALLAAYVTAIGVLGLVCSVVPGRSAVLLLRRAARGPARWIVGSALGATMLLPRPVTFERVPEPVVISIETETSERGPISDGDSGSEHQEGTTSEGAPPPIGIHLDDAVDAVPGSARTWEVQPGDHLWSIAARQVSGVGPRALGPGSASPPSTADIHAYWVRLIEANEARFVVAGQPALIRPGQVRVLPAIANCGPTAGVLSRGGANGRRLWRPSSPAAMS